MLRRAALAGLLAVAFAPAAAARDLPAIRKAGVLRALVVPIEHEPEFVDLGSKTRPGFDIEVLQGFARAQKLELEIVRQSAWDQLIPALQKEEGDLIAGRFTDSESRRRQIHFTQPVFPTGVVVVTLKPHRIVNTIEELREEKVGTIRGTSMDEALAAAGFKGKVDYSTLDRKELVDGLKSGEVTAAVWGLEGAIAAANRDRNVQIGLMLGPPAALAYGVRKEDSELLAALDAHIAMLRKTGVWQRLVVRYLGASAQQVLNRAGDGTR